ncbi:anti-sigma factor domain-containing protein [Aquabacter cavernae]|uniref:anti-sigma factor domain-containing protein n=1 Tax=Aquabacter cavernae TaxID=2496029 RepID=UPI000F8E4CEC|nr:hypothetical protein [Aquabacter cavernae]
MNTRNELSRSAAEYVLGTLDAAERAAMREWMVADPEVAALVRMWERRFSPLLELSAPARLPSTLLDDILSKLPLDLPAKVPPVPVAEAVSPPEPAVPEADQAATENSAEVAAPEVQSSDVEVSASEPQIAVQPVAEAAPPEAADAPPVPPVPVPEEEAAPPIETVEPPSPPEAGGEKDEADVSQGEAPVVGDPLSSAMEEVAQSTRAIALLAAVPPDGEAAIEPPTETPETGAGTDEVPPVPEPAPTAAPSVAEAPAVDVADAPEAPPLAPALPAPEPSTSGRDHRGWRRLSGVLMLVLLAGAGTVAYREMQRPAPPLPAPPPPPPVVQVVPPPAPPPPEEVADAFAVLGPQPVPAIGLTLDVDTGTVTVLKLPAPAGEGMHYDLWLVSDQDGPQRLASFRETGSVQSDAVRALERDRLDDTFLIITRESDAEPSATPSGAPVYSGMAVAR